MFRYDYIFKKYIKNRSISDININICENIKSFQKRFDVHKKNIFLFSSIHNIDLIVFLFGNPLKIQKINSFIGKIEEIGFFIFYYKNFKIKVTFLNNCSENSTFTIRLKNQESIILTHNTNLKIYSGLNVISKKNNKIYKPILKKIFKKIINLNMVTISRQIYFLKNKLTSSIDSYKITYNIIKKLS